MFGRSKDEPEGHDDVPAQTSAGGVVRRRVEAVRFEPPRNLRPAMVGVLLDGTIEDREIAVMLVDLSARGWYTMEQDDAGRWAFVTPRALPPRDADLLDAERLLLEVMFRPSPVDTPGDDVPVQYVSMTSLTHRLEGHKNAIRTALGEQLVRDGLATRNPATPGRLLGRRPLLTAAGEAAREECAGYRLYLSRAEAGALVHADAEGFIGDALPYAVAFDIVPRWAAAIGASPVSGSGAAATMLRDLRSNPLLVGVASAGSSGLDLRDLMTLSVARNYGARFPGEAAARR